MEKNLNKTNQKSLNSHIDSINLDNDIKSVKQLVAQVVENINGLEMSFLNASTIQNLDQKTKEGEKLLEELQKINLKDYESNIRVETFNETLANAGSFVQPSIQLKSDIVDMSNNLINMTLLIAELKNFTQKARESTINAELILKDKLKEMIEEKINQINKHVQETEMLIADGYKFNNETVEGSNSLQKLQTDIEQENKNLNADMERLRKNMEERSLLIPDAIRDTEQAKIHASEIENQSADLSRKFSSTRNLATDPLRAANAYNNISLAIEDAELAIKPLKGLEVDALKDPILQENVKRTNEELGVTEKSLADLKARYKRNSDQTSMLDDKAKSPIELLDSVKEKLNDTASLVTDLRGIEKIKQQVDKVKLIDKRVKDLLISIDTLSDNTKELNSYLNFTSDIRESEDYLKQLSNSKANNLKNFDQEFMDKNQATFDRLKDSIGDKITDLKKRIQIAKHQANNIRVGAMFNNNSVLELNNPPNLASSSTFNKFSMQFFAQSPDGLLAYIGNPISSDTNASKKKKKRDAYDETNLLNNSPKTDFICLEIRRGRVTLIWDLGSGQPNELVDEQNVYDNNWHNVIVERYGKLVKLIVKTNDKETENSKLTEGTSSLLNLDPQISRIFIGGISQQVKVSSSIVNHYFMGNISNLIFDNEPMGLWNLKHSSNVYGGAPFDRSTTNSLRFNGNSYVILRKTETMNFKENLYVSFVFKTFVKNGLLFLVGEPALNEYLSVEIYKGSVVLRYELGSAPMTVVSNGVYNDGKWHFVKVNREDKESMLTVDQFDEQTGFSLGMSTDLSTDDNIYIGGFPGHHPYFDVSKDGFDGCIKDLQIGTDQQNLNNNKESYGISLGCSSDFIRTVSFVEHVNQVNSFVVYPIQEVITKDRLQVAFKFVTLSKLGLLLHLSNEDSSIYFNVYLNNGMLLLHTNQNDSLKTDKHVYNDNQWHYVTIEIDQNMVKMDIDDFSLQEVALKEPINFALLGMINVGGLPPPIDKQFGPMFGDFIGCIGDITLNEQFVNFAASTDKQNAQFTKCALAGQADLPVTDLLPPKSFSITPESKRKPIYKMLPPIGNCKLPPIPRMEESNLQMNEVRFGDTLWSRYEFSISNDVSKGLENESGFQIKFKTTQANGIIFYITSSNGIDFVGLYFVNNKLHYGFDCGSGHGVVSLKNEYADGQWHSATFSRKGKNGLIRVDDETAEVTSLGATSALNVKSPIYIGGIPEELATETKGHLKAVDKDFNHAMTSFSGCLKDLKVRDLEYKFQDGRGVDVAPCSDQVEYGHFFHYDGGYIRLMEEFRVRVEFTLTMQIKPRKMDGILAAVFGKTDYLALYLDKGKITFVVDNGAVRSLYFYILSILSICVVYTIFILGSVHCYERFDYGQSNKQSTNQFV